MPLDLAPVDTTVPLDVFARIYGEPLLELPKDLYIPPDALQVILEAFEGPLDLLLYLIRKANLDVLDIRWRRSPRNISCMSRRCGLPISSWQPTIC